MPTLDLSFDWLVDDAGYRIQEPKKRKRSDPDPTVYYSRGTDFTSGPTIKMSDINRGPSIVRRGGELRIIRPLEFHRTLFMDFAHLDGSEESCLSFADRFGFLSLIASDKPEKIGGNRGERLYFWRDCIAQTRRVVDAWQSNPETLLGGQELTVTQLSATLVPIDGRAGLRIRPSSLIGAINLQFAQAVSSGLDIRTCDHCRKLFEAGGTGRTRKARFCSDRCRSDYHVAKRKQS